MIVLSNESFNERTHATAYAYASASASTIFKLCVLFWSLICTHCFTISNTRTGTERNQATSSTFISCSTNRCNTNLGLEKQSSWLSIKNKCTKNTMLYSSLDKSIKQENGEGGEKEDQVIITTVKIDPTTNNAKGTNGNNNNENNNNNNNDNNSNANDNTPTENSLASNTNNETQEKKPMSRLAMAAADWLEEEEDELSNYWNKFEEAKSNSNTNVSGSSGSSGSDSGSSSTISSTNNESSNQQKQQQQLTTQERLDKYYKGRGIDKKFETKYANEIKKAIQKANQASNASEAIQILIKVRPYMQPNTKLGGEALIELSQAYRANGEDDEVGVIYELLKSNPHLDVRRRMRQIIENPSRYRKEYGKNKNLWNSFEWGSWWS